MGERAGGVAQALELEHAAEGTRIGALQAGLDALKEGVRIGVGKAGERGGQGLGGVERLFGVLFDAFHRLDIELGFDDGEALQAPLGSDHFVDQVEFRGAVRAELIEVGREELVEFGRILGGQDQHLGGEAVFEGVLGRTHPAGFGFGAARFCAVDAG